MNNSSNGVVNDDMTMAHLIRNRLGAPRCPKCGMWSDRADAQFCLECGTKLVENEYVSHADENHPPVNVDDLFTDAWLQSVNENTKQFSESLQLPTWEEMNNPQLQSSEDQSAIARRAVVIDGAPGSGKSTKIGTIIDAIRRKYGADKVGVQIVQGEDFDTIFTRKWEKKPIQIVVNNDATDKTFKKADIGKFWDLRHILEEKTGFKRGLIFTIISTHSYFKIPDEFRTVEVNAILFSDMPTSPKGTFHRNIFNQFIPDEQDRKRLLALQEQRQRNVPMRGFAYWLRFGQPVGFIYLKQVPSVKTRFKLHLPSLRRAKNTKIEEKAQSTQTSTGETGKSVIIASFGWLVIFGGLAVYNYHLANDLWTLIYGVVAAAPFLLKLYLRLRH